MGSMEAANQRSCESKQPIDEPMSLGIIEEFVTVRPGIEIGPGTIVKCGAILGTGVKVGKNCFVGPGAILLHKNPGKGSFPCEVGDNVFIGSGAVICPGVKVCSDVVIGAGSVVIKSIVRPGVYAGNPCSMIKTDGIKIGRNVIVDEPFVFGKDVWIGSFVHIRPNTSLSDKVEIRDHVFIGPDVTVGENTRIYQFCNISKGTKIGRDCFIGMGVMTQNDKEIHYPDKGAWVSTPPVIGNRVRIGAGSLILPGITIADDCRIGAGAVVTKSTEAGFTYLGNPAKKI